MKRRGSAFLTVLAVLALLTIMMGTAMQMLVSHISESKRRGDSAYAGELARSGVEWARACIANHGTSCSTRLDVAGGTIAVSSTFDGEIYTVTSRGTVTHGTVEGLSRQATARVRAPDPGEPAPSQVEGPPSERGVTHPGPAPQQPGGDQRSPEETPQYF